MRSNERRKIPKLKGDDGTEMKRREIVAAEQRIEKAWPHPIDLYAHSFFRSIGYRRFKFETSTPGLPRHYLYGLAKMILGTTRLGSLDPLEKSGFSAKAHLFVFQEIAPKSLESLEGLGPHPHLKISQF